MNAEDLDPKYHEAFLAQWKTWHFPQGFTGVGFAVFGDTYGWLRGWMSIEDGKRQELYVLGDILVDAGILYKIYETRAGYGGVPEQVPSYALTEKGIALVTYNAI